MLTLFAAPDDPRSWEDIPGVGLIGGIIGVVLLIAAIRMFIGKGK